MCDGERERGRRMEEGSKRGTAMLEQVNCATKH